MADIKMEWTKPQLIVLARGMPEESVLVNCKTMNPNQAVQGRSDLLFQDTCAYGNSKDNCQNCQSRGVNDT